MALKGLFWLAFLFILAVALALLGRLDAGQVLLIYPPYRVDVTLNFAVLALIVFFALLYALTRVARNVWTVPRRVSAYRGRAREAKAHAALRDAIGNLYAGRFSRAEKAARAAAAHGSNRVAAGLIAAEATHRMHEYSRRDAWLASIDSPDWQDARLMASANMHVDGHDAQGALAALAEMRSQGAHRIHAQQIALRAQQQLKNWVEVLKLAKVLEKHEAIHPAVAVRLRQQAAENLLRERRHDAHALREFWQTLAATERYSPRLADLAAELLIHLNQPRQACKVIEEALAHNWDARLLRRYPETAGEDALALIQKAETWRKDRPEDADLLFSLGRLCLHQQLWGKAQSFLEAALAGSTNDALTIRTHRALARLFEHIGDMARASEHYRASALAMKIV